MCRRGLRPHQRGRPRHGHGAAPNARRSPAGSRRPRASARRCRRCRRRPARGAQSWPPSRIALPPSPPPSGGRRSARAGSPAGRCRACRPARPAAAARSAAARAPRQSARRQFIFQLPSTKGVARGIAMAPGSGRCRVAGRLSSTRARRFPALPRQQLAGCLEVTGCLDFGPAQGLRSNRGPRSASGGPAVGARHAQCTSQTGGFLGRQGPADAARRQLRDLGHRRRVLRQLAKSRGRDGRRKRDLGQRACRRLQPVAAQPAAEGRHRDRRASRRSSSA